MSLSAALDAYRARLLQETEYINLAGIPLPRNRSGIGGVGGVQHAHPPLGQVRTRARCSGVSGEVR